MPENMVCSQLAAACIELSKGFEDMTKKPASLEHWQEAVNALREVLRLAETEAQKQTC